LDSGHPRVGEIAPDFKLRRTFEEEVSLSGLLRRGPVVLAFYVFDYGPV
jgi:peroxiredoxin